MGMYPPSKNKIKRTRPIAERTTVKILRGKKAWLTTKEKIEKAKGIYTSTKRQPTTY